MFDVLWFPPRCGRDPSTWNPLPAPFHTSLKRSTFFLLRCFLSCIVPRPSREETKTRTNTYIIYHIEVSVQLNGHDNHDLFFVYEGGTTGHSLSRHCRRRRPDEQYGNRWQLSDPGESLLSSFLSVGPHTLLLLQLL